MKKITISVLIVVITIIVCLLIKLVFFNKTVPTGDENGEILTVYSSKDMLGKWDFDIYKIMPYNVTEQYTGNINVTRLSGNYFYGTITFKVIGEYRNRIKGDTLDIEGTVYNDIVTINFIYQKEQYSLNYEAKFYPKVLNNFLTLELNDKVQEGNNTYEYKFLLMRKEEFNNEK